MNITYEDLANAMDKIAVVKSENAYKYRVFKNFAMIIRATKSMDLNYLSTFKGVGVSCISHAHEFIENGFNEITRDFQLESNPLTEVAGIGETRAQELIEAGYTTPKELNDLNLEVGELIPNTRLRMTQQIKSGLQFMAHTDMNRMTRSQYEEVASPLKWELTMIFPDSEIILAGSYRRNKPTIGDIDIIVFTDINNLTSKNYHDTAAVFDQVVVMGDKKISGIKSSRQVDIRIVDKSFYGPMVLHSTGPAAFNINCRKLAISKGYKLSEYGLYQGEDRIDSNSEESILELLGLEYIAPESRESYIFN